MHVGGSPSYNSPERKKWQVAGRSAGSVQDLGERFRGKFGGCWGMFWRFEGLLRGVLIGACVRKRLNGTRPV